jgi:carboxypeptidase C (cathepsin A)
MYEQQLNKLKLEVKRNSRENLNILQGERIFTRSIHGKYEILVDLKTNRNMPRIWGHIFNKNNKYITCLVSIEGCFKAKDTEELFNSFWWFIEEQGNWCPVKTTNKCETFKITDHLENALEFLTQIVKNFSDINAHDDEQVEGVFDYRVVKVYPFRDPFRETIDFNTWQQNVQSFN